MSLDEKAEDELYAAVAKVLNLNRPVQKERILKATITAIMLNMGWNKVEMDNE